MGKIDIDEIEARPTINQCPRCERAEATLTYLTPTERDALVRVVKAADKAAGLIVAGYPDEIAAKKELLAALADIGGEA